MNEDKQGGREARDGELFRLLAENVVDYAIFIVDVEGLVQTWSHGAGRLLGYSEDEILGRTADVFFTPEDVRDDVPRRERREAIETGRGEDDRWHVRKDGARFWVSGVMTPLRDEDGKLRGFAKIMRDRTDWWHAEQARREGEGRHRAILESITDAFFALGRGWRFTYVNRKAEDLLGRTRGDLLGKHLWEEYAPALGTEFERSYRRAMDEGVTVTFEAFYPPHDRWYEVHAYPSPDGLSVYFRDVNERKRAEQDHARLTLESEQQRRIYETALSSTPDFNYVFDLDGRFTYANASLLAIWRKGPDEVLGRDFFDLGYSPEEAALHQREIQQVIHTKQPLRAETPFTSHLGERQYEYIFMPVLGSGGAVEAVVGSTRDITERKRHEEELRASEEKHRAILESITDAFFTLDRDWRFTYVNRRAEALLGRSREGLLGKALWQEYPETVGNEIERRYRRAMDEGLTVDFDEFYPPHGRWYENHIYPAKDGISVYFRDITARKRAESDRDRLIEKVDDERRHLQALIESSPDCIKELDLGGRLLSVSENGRKLLEIRDVCEFLDKPWLDFWQGEEREKAEWAISRALAGGVGSFEAYCPTAAGTARWWDVVVTPILDSEGKPHRLLSVSRDVTERRRDQEERERLLAEAQGANRAKDHFLAVLSHELRTPLNPILLAASSMLERTPDPEEVRPTLEMIRQNVKLQARLIDDLLDVMRIVQGKMPLHWGVSDCHALIGQSIEICRSEFLGKSQEILLDLSAEHHHVNADSARLHQVLWNLVRNAVKFTPEGGKVTVRTRNEVVGEQHIVIEVADTGIGIEPDVLPTIWDPFQQGETTITRRFGGLGLGLAICKGIVDAHGGTLAVESEGSGLGTTFRVVLKTMAEPPIEAEGGSGEVRSLPPLNPLNILLVEDEAATLRLMARLLKGLGHRVTAAGTVADAWGAFQADGFDMIVSDIGLPDGTGLDLMRKVKAVRRVPAIALTGYGMDEDVRRSREAGFTTHMTKPIDFTKLEAMIRQVAN